MRIPILGLLLVIFLLGCQNRTPQGPIPKDDLIEILLDIHTAESALSYLYGMKRDTIADRYFQEIYIIHDVTEEDFRASIQAMRNDPEYIKDIYTTILDSLDRKITD